MQKEERQKNEDRMKEAIEEMKEKEQVSSLVILNLYILYVCVGHVLSTATFSH